MNRFFVNRELIIKDKIILADKDEIHHLTKVLRTKVGEKVEVSDGNETEYLCKISTIEKEEVELEILEKTQIKRELPVDIDIFQGVPKQGKLEEIVKKSVELGANSITPVFMERSIVSKSEREGKKIDRLNGIALSAAKQSKRGIVPVVKMPINFKMALEDLGGKTLIVFPYENEKSKTIKELLRENNIHNDLIIKSTPQNLSRQIESIGVIIGPEGGFSQEEVRLHVEAGASPVTLGPRILRTETASLSVLSIIAYELEL